MAKPYISDALVEDKKQPIQMANADILMRAIGIVREEKQRWEVATAFVTDRV